MSPFFPSFSNPQERVRMHKKPVRENELRINYSKSSFTFSTCLLQQLLLPTLCHTFFCPLFCKFATISSQKINLFMDFLASLCVISVKWMQILLQCVGIFPTKISFHIFLQKLSTKPKLNRNTNISDWNKSFQGTNQ